MQFRKYILNKKKFVNEFKLCPNSPSGQNIESIRSIPNDKEFDNKIGGRDVTVPDFWENEYVGQIIPVIGCLGIGIILLVLVNLSTSFFVATRDSFPISTGNIISIYVQIKISVYK